LNGWKVVFTCLILFPGLGNLSAIVLRYRLKVAGTGAFAKKQLTYICEYSPAPSAYSDSHHPPAIVFFSIFFSGLSLQILSALICHMIGYQMTWAATLKTVEASNFFKEVPDIMRKFKFTLPLNILMVVSNDCQAVQTLSVLILVVLNQVGMILTTSSLMPLDWRVSSIEAIIPMAMTVGSHILYPSESCIRRARYDSDSDSKFLPAVVLNPWLVHFTF
jgi:hypothetical protein